MYIFHYCVYYVWATIELGICYYCVSVDAMHMQQRSCGCAAVRLCGDQPSEISVATASYTLYGYRGAEYDFIPFYTYHTQHIYSTHDRDLDFVL